MTGAGDTVGRHPGVPVTPEQIAEAAIEAARAGAAIAHVHVREPETGKGSRDPALFRDVVERVRASDTDVVINLTSGMGGDWVPSTDDPAMPSPGTDMVGPVERLAHVAELRPEICSIDCGTMNFGNGDEIYISTPACLRRMAQMVRDWDVKPELEVFELERGRGRAVMAAEYIDARILVIVRTLPVLVVLPASLTPRRHLSMPAGEFPLRHNANLFGREAWLASVWKSGVVPATFVVIALSPGARTPRTSVGIEFRHWRLRMDIELNHEQRMLLDTVRSFMEKEIYPHENVVDRRGHVPPELGRQIEKRAIEAGLYAANLPESVGGAD